MTPGLQGLDITTQTHKKSSVDSVLLVLEIASTSLCSALIHQAERRKSEVLHRAPNLTHCRCERVKRTKIAFSIRLPLI